MKKISISILSLAYAIIMTSICSADPLVIAHRGYSSIAPENTLAAVNCAVKLDPQPSYIEIDLHASSDGVLVVSHDSNTNRTTGVNKMIRDYPFSDLRKLDAGYKEKFEDKFKNERLPNLEEVLDAVKDSPIGIMIECKQLLVEDRVVDMLRKRNELDKHVIASFDELTVYRAKKLEPKVRTLYLAGDINADTIGRAKDMKSDIIGVNSKVKPESILAAQKAGFKVWVWTVDDPADMRKFIKAKADGIITNKPALAIKVVQK